MPVRVLMSAAAQAGAAESIARIFAGRPHAFVSPGQDADLAFVSRDVTGLSTKHVVLPETQRFYDAMLSAPSLRWVHVHSAGADRPVYGELLQRGIRLSTSSGANAEVVVQTALAGILALARRLPQLMEAQHRREWTPLIGAALPRDLAGQTALVVGWGPIGQGIAALLRALGVAIAVARSSDAPAGADVETARYEEIDRLLPRADWLILACPLSPRTTGLIDAARIGLLPAGAHVVNVARGAVLDEAALLAALASGRIAGAHLDVFAHEPLAADSPLWSAANVIVTPHSAGHSDGNEARVRAAFLANLRRWLAGDALLHEVDAISSP